MSTAAVTVSTLPVVAALIALFGVLVTLVINGIRADRQRRRDLHARSLAAITAYGEMPYRIRRRPAGDEHRARLADELSVVKSEVDVCQILLAADGDERLSDAYDDLYSVARRTVGTAAHDAWKLPVITDDAEMNMGDLYRALNAFTTRRLEFADELRAATLPPHRRISRWVRSGWRWTSRIPGVRPPRPAIDRRITAPQDLEGDPPDAPTGS